MMPELGHFALCIALALAFVSLALISGIAYIIVLAGATGTAERLLVDRAQRVVERQVTAVKKRLDPVTEQLELIAALIAAGRIDIEDPVVQVVTDSPTELKVRVTADLDPSSPTSQSHAG